MAENEVNIITHLIEVEQNAEKAVADAQTESSKKIAVAKTEADEKFNRLFEQKLSRLEADFAEKTAVASEKHSSLIKEYKNTILASSRDTDAFNKFLDKVLSV